MKKFVIALAVGTVLVTASGCSNSDWNDWASDCIAAGGQTSLTNIDFWAGERYECFIDGEIVTLPGWEGY